MCDDGIRSSLNHMCASTRIVFLCRNVIFGPGAQPKMFKMKYFTKLMKPVQNVNNIAMCAPKYGSRIGISLYAYVPPATNSTLCCRCGCALYWNSSTLTYTHTHAKRRHAAVSLLLVK